MKRSGPYNVMRNPNDWDQSPRMPAAVGGAILSGIGVSAATASTVIAFNVTLATAVGYVATSLITSWAMSALMPKPDFGAATSGTILSNNVNGIAAQDFVYGKVRKGGIITFYESTGDNNIFLHQIICLAGHEVNSIGDVYINDQVATFSGDFVTVAGTGDDQTTWGSKIRIKKYDGSQTAVDADLVSETSVDANFKGLGVAYLYIRYEYDQDIFASGVPTVTAVVEGKKVYDPRTDTTAYSNNAALCIRDYIVSGYGLDDASVDNVYFSAAANECDENISLSGGGTEKRYEINGIVQADRSIGDVLSDMMTACAGYLFWGSGAWRLKAGAYSAPVKTLTLDDLRGPIKLDTRASIRSNFNSVIGTFNDADQKWVTADYPKVSSVTNAGLFVVGDVYTITAVGNTNFAAIGASSNTVGVTFTATGSGSGTGKASAFLGQDNGEEASLDLQLPFTTSASAAQRLAKLTLFRGREQMTFSADFGLEAFSVEAGDIVAFTNERYGFSAKEFEVVGWKFASSQDAGDLRVTLTLRETSEAAFDWNAEEVAITSNDTTLPIFSTVNAPTNLTLAATTSINSDGAAIPAIKATWDLSPNAFVQYYEIQYKRTGGEEDYGSITVAQNTSEDWGSVVSSATSAEDYGLTNEPILAPDAQFASVFGSSNSFTIEPVLNGYDYQVRIRAVSAIGVRSPFVTASTASLGDTTPPNEPLSLSAVGGSKYITISWINPADQDLSFVEVWENSTNNLSTATMIGTSSSSNFMRPNLENNTSRYYWVRAVDHSLNKSAFTSSVNATTLLITPNDFNDAVNDLFSESGAFGIEPVSSLPASGAFDGKLVLLLPDVTIYRWDATTSAWSTEIFTASSVDAGSVTYNSFATGIEPVGVVSSLPTVSGYSGPQVVVLTTDGKLYRLVSGAWTSVVNTDDIAGTLGENLFSEDLRPIERVSSLPSTGLTQGRVVMLTGDSKLYRYTGDAWTSAVPATDLTGQLSTVQVADSAITQTKISDGSITTPKISSGAVTANEISSGAVTANKIAVGAVTADKISVGTITADKIAAGTITANEIASNAITTDKIAANAIVTGSIAAGAVSTSQLASNAVTADKIFAGAVTASEIATDAVTSNKILSGSIISSKIAAGAVTANKISVSELSAISANLGTIEVDTANIKNASVETLKIADNSVTQEGVAGSSGVTNNSSTWTSVASFNFNNLQDSANVQGTISFLLTTTPSNLPSNFGIQVLVNGAIVSNLTSNSAGFISDNNRFNIRAFSALNVPSGTRHVTFRMQNMGGQGVNFSNLSATAAMR